MAKSYLLSQQAVNQLRDLAPAIPSESGMPQKRPIFGDAEGEQGQLHGVVVRDTNAASNIDIWLCYQLWGDPPPDLELGEATEAGTLNVLNIFSQDLKANDTVVAFETFGEEDQQVDDPGLSVASDADLAASDSDDLAAIQGVGQATGGSGIWWGFSPVVGQSGAIGYVEQSIPAASYSSNQLSLSKGGAFLFVEGPGQDVLEQSAEAVDVYNPFTAGSVGPGIVTLKIVDGRWIIDAEDCPA